MGKRKLQWGDRVMHLFLDGNSDGGAAVKKRITSSENPCMMETRAHSRKNIKLRDEDCWIDQISRLPDELLVSILSLLSLKEAAASSILSRRWRFLWTLRSKLDFEFSDLWTGYTSKPDFDNRYYTHESKDKPCVGDCWEYVGWVDKVLGLLDKSAAMEELRISCSLDETHQSYLDKWIEFALAKKVERLDMNLVQPCATKFYTFPYKLLCGNSCSLKDLRLLRMVCVKMCDGALEIILRSCPLLEEIFIAKCSGLCKVKIVNPLPALIRLTLIFCYELESVEVCDSNLVYLMYRGLGTHLKHFLLKNVPLLVEMNVGGDTTEDVEKFITMFSSKLPQLEKLTIVKQWELSVMEANMICTSVKMSNLRQLVWKYSGFYLSASKLEAVAIIVGALPLLQRLVVQSYGDSWKANVDYLLNLERSSYRKTHTYSNLKQVEFVGYHGYGGELALLLHFLEHAVALQEITIHPAKDTFIKNEIGEYTKQETDTFRAFANAQLTTRLPSTVALNIL